MKKNRRLWLKQVGLGVVGVGISSFQSWALPATQNFIDIGTNNNPVLLRSNENPYGPSLLARNAIAENLNISNRYNWSIASQLISDIANRNNVKDENILLGAGSTEILDLVSKLAALKKGNYIVADPSYTYWTTILDNSGLKKRKVPLTADKKTDLQAMSKAVNRDTKLVYICNPNNPTGTICDSHELVEFVTNIPGNTIVVIDEAYLEYTQQLSLSNLTNDYPNIVIIKTFSKIYGLAGARIGYAIANKTMIENLVKQQSNTNNSVGVLSKLAAIASLKDEKFISDCYSLNEAVRKYTVSELEKSNCKCISSNTNFIYFSLSNYDKDYFQQLENNNIQGTRVYEEHGKWTRITVGTMQEMTRFINAIQ